jgi:hypothetical protein
MHHSVRQAAGAVTLMILNTVNITAAVRPVDATGGDLLRGGFDEYLLTPADEKAGLSSAHVALNGKELSMLDPHGDNPALPSMPATPRVDPSITLPGISFGFYVLHNAKAAACKHDDDAAAITPMATGSAAQTTVAAEDPRLIYEGRWQMVGGIASADWPCSGLRFVVNSTRGSGGLLSLSWLGLRTRLQATVAPLYGGAPITMAVFTGPTVDLQQEPQQDQLHLPGGGLFEVRLHKLTQATPYSMGVGRLLRPSVLHLYSLALEPALVLLLPPAAAIRTRKIEFIGASDTAGYCVDGTPNTSSVGDTLFGFEYSNCNLAYPAVLGRALGATVSVQALAGAGLTQNANAARTWEDGKLTMADLYNRTLQTQPVPVWRASRNHSPAALVVISLGGNDYNHQNGHVPNNASFTAAYTRLLDRIFESRESLELAGQQPVTVASICGMGSPAEAGFDPDNNRCRPCTHVEAAVQAYQRAWPGRQRRVAYFFVPCDGSVVNDRGDIGCDGHKNKIGQAEVAHFLEARLRKLMGWTGAKHDDEGMARPPLSRNREQTLVAHWPGPINGLPMNNLPAGPLTGQGDLGLTIQTGNGSGAVEFWLGLNQFSGAPNSSESFGGRPLRELQTNYTNGPDKTLDPRVPYPRIVSLGGVTVASAHFAGSSVSFEATQHFSNGTLTTRYTRADGETLASVSTLDPGQNRMMVVVTACGEVGLSAAEAEAIEINITTWTRTLHINATAAAAARTTRAGITAAGVQYFARLPIPPNAGRVTDGYQGAVATQISGIAHTVVGHRTLFNTSAAAAAGLAADAVAVGAETQLTLARNAGKCTSLTLITTVLTNLDLGNLSADPLAVLLASLDGQEGTNHSGLGLAADIERRNSDVWAEWWGRSSVSLPAQPRLEEFWYVAQYMLFATSRDVGSPTVRRYGAAMGGLYGPWISSDDSDWAAVSNGPIDYNMQGPRLGALSSNRADALLSYMATVEAFVRNHGRTGALDTAWFVDNRDSERNAAVAAAGASAGPGRNLTQCVLDSPAAVHLPCGLGPRGHLSGGLGNSPLGDMKQRWCGTYAALLFVNYYEFTGDVAFARERLFPLLKGLGDFWRCYLVHVPEKQQQRGYRVTTANSDDIRDSGGSLGIDSRDSYVLGNYDDSVGEQGAWDGCSEEMGCRIDWPYSPTNNPGGCCIAWRDPIFATAQNRRLFDMLGVLAKELDEPVEPWWADIVAHLPPLTVGTNVFNVTNTWLMAPYRLPLGTRDRHWLGAFTSGMFGGLWPIYPAETVDADSPSAQIATGRNTASSMFIMDDRSVAVQFFPPAVRASIGMETPIRCNGVTPLFVCLNQWLQWNTNYSHPTNNSGRPWSPYALRRNLFPIIDPNNPGGIESIGLTDAINTMLLATTAGSGRQIIWLFPVWRNMQKDGAGPASFSRLVAKGGFEVTAALVENVVSNVTIRSTAGRACAIVSPWHPDGPPTNSSLLPTVVELDRDQSSREVAVRWLLGGNRSVFEFNTTINVTYAVSA